YNLMFNGQHLSNAEYTDNFVENDTEYCYKVTAQYGTEEGPMSTASCATPEAQTIHEIAYDDGEAETSTNVGSGNYLAVKITPDRYPSELKRVKFYVPTTSPGICGIRVWDDDGEDGLPGTEWTPPSGIIMQLAQGWNVKDMSSLGIYIGSGDFYVGWEETGNTPPIGIDLSDPDFRSYINIDDSPPVGTDGEWADLYLDGDFMVRVEVDSGVLAIDDDLVNVIPENFTLRQNYPNPFNPVTNISFEIPEFAKTHLAVFDLTGREVKTLVNNENMNAGRYIYQLNAADLPSGMYFYRILAISEAGHRFSDTKKLVLLK
ncbi:MAG TPA: T9SS type A sorting domain-containing protein, partial [Candidatus Marinimicrobia bacterium]|nr:T9SS type A sorting domain-containing protein [Candidatus Neomarinimicrobiota bacterium]